MSPIYLTRVLHCVAVCCSVLQCVAVCCSVLHCVAVCCSVLQCVAVCCSVLQCVAVCCSVMQCIALCCIVLRFICVCAHVSGCSRSEYSISCVHTLGICVQYRSTIYVGRQNTIVCSLLTHYMCGMQMYYTHRVPECNHVFPPGRLNVWCVDILYTISHSNTRLISDSLYVWDVNTFTYTHTHKTHTYLHTNFNITQLTHVYSRMYQLHVYSHTYIHTL